jgi:hypothetical protein
VGNDLLDGTNNIFIGRNVADGVTGSGVFQDNVAIGRRAYISGNSGNARSVSLGFEAVASASDQIRLGRDNAAVYVHTKNALELSSDVRQKTEIKDINLGIDFVNKLRPVEYKWNEDTNRTHYGLIAQEVRDLAIESDIQFNGYGKNDNIAEDTKLTLAYTEFIAPLIKAVQDLSTQNQELLSRIEALESTN